MVNAIESFKTAIQAHGLQPPDTIQPGKLHRFPGLNKKPGDDAAWCKLFDDLCGGVFGDFSAGLDEHWQCDTERTYSAEERQAFRQRCEAERKARDTEQRQQHTAAAIKAAEILAVADGDPAQHPYALKKVVAFGHRVKRGAWPQRGWTDALLLPIYGAGGKFWTLEAINSDGKKDYLKDGRKRGCFYPLGKIRGANRVLIGEGVATVAAVHAVDGAPAVAAMDSGNLSAVALAVRTLAPDAEIILLADNDIKPDGSNPGLKAATKAAQVVGGFVAVPELDGQKCDFWDVWQQRGADAVRDALSKIQSFATAIVAIPATDEKKPDEDAITVKISLFDDDGRKKSQATLLIELASEHNLFHCPQHDSYIEITEYEITKTLPLRTKDFKEFLGHKFYKLTGKGANTTAISDAQNTLEAIAKHSGKKHDVYLRMANLGDAVYLDVGCDKWRVIEVNADGWRILDKSPIKFYRRRGMSALPHPVNSDISKLKRFINLDTDSFTLLLGWLVAVIGGVKPYPILILQGEQGTGKSTVCRILRALTDASTVPLRSPPKELRDLLVSAANNYLVVLDNLSGLNPEISDCLCRLSTGGGIDLRSLYTDNEQVLIDIQRPIMVNGIDEIAARPDLMERSVILDLPVISDEKRIDEESFYADFDNCKGAIFGALLDGVAHGLANIKTTNLIHKPRMADFAKWVTACEPGLGLGNGDFMRAYQKNRDSVIAAGIESSPVGVAIMGLVEKYHNWEGTPTKLLTELENIASLNQIKARAWPQSPKGLSNSIKRLMPSFRSIGIEIEKEITHDRLYKIRSSGIYPPQAPQAPHATNDAGLSGADSGRLETDGADSGRLVKQPQATDDVVRGGWGGWGGYIGTSPNDTERF